MLAPNSLTSTAIKHAIDLKVLRRWAARSRPLHRLGHQYDRSHCQGRTPHSALVSLQLLERYGSKPQVHAPYGYSVSSKDVRGVYDYLEIVAAAAEQ